MKATFRLFGRLSILCGVLGCVTMGIERGQAPLTRGKPLRAVPLTEQSLPYAGPGTVWILNNATIIVDVGSGDLLLDENGEVIGTSPLETIGYRVDTAGLTLVHYRDEYFLDWNGAQIHHRGLESELLTKTLFPDRELRGASNLYALMEVSGAMTLAFDEQTNKLSLSVRNVETQEEFVLQGNFLPEPSVLPSQPGEVRAKPQIGDDPIVVPLQLTVNSCSADCGPGSYCTIGCKAGYGATCFCRRGVASCRCVAE